MNVAWIAEPICPRHPSHSGLKIWANLAWNYNALWSWNIGQFGLKIGQYGMEIWAHPIWPGNSGYLARKYRPIWPWFIRQYGLENPEKSDLDIWAALAKKSMKIWPRNLANLAWKSGSMWPRNMSQFDLAIRANLVWKALANMTWNLGQYGLESPG